MNKRNENRPGYRETKVGWIPEDWKAEHLASVVDMNRESLSERNTEENYSFYYLTLSDVSEGNFSKPEKKFRFNLAPSRARRKFTKGDVLLSTVRPNLKGFGFVDFNANEFICSTGFAVLHPKNKFDGEFIYHYLYSNNADKYFYACVVGSNYPALNKNDVEKLWIPLPPEKERAEIAKILTTWDKAIELVDKQINTKQRLKKGLIQQLLTEKMRFPGFDGPWKEMQLGEFLKMKLRKVEKPKEAYLRLGIRSHGKGTFTTIVEDPQSVDMTYLYQVKEGNLIVSITFAWEGAIAIVESDADGAYVSHRFPTFIFDTQKVVSEFFRYLMCTPRFFYELGVVSPGGAGRNRVMSKQNFFKIKVRVPSVKEQRLIGGILTALDGDINKLSELLEQLNFQKQGLMQKLLNGEVRVKV